jgi:hypothetical protein
MDQTNIIRVTKRGFAGIEKIVWIFAIVD